MAFLLHEAPRRKEAGFTLFEVLAAFVLLSLCLGRLIPALVQIREGELRAEQRLDAYLFGAGKLQEIIFQAERGEEGRFAGPGFEYPWRFDEEERDDLIIQTLTVKWKDHDHEQAVQIGNLQAKAD